MKRYTDEALRSLVAAAQDLIEEATKLVREERERRQKRDRA